MKKFLIWVFSIMLIVSTATYSSALNTRAEETSSPEILLDIIFLRPLGLISTVIGTTVFVISLPISIPTKSADDVAKKMVAGPFNYTFRRPVGTLN
jgi:hypothetical protein